ncbi:MAG: FAD binding domain-containing protein [Gammaproteobacteria bacterium]|nr:FAD binding domain-containing protein [Gammaproteobacteria bacterium]
MSLPSLKEYCLPASADELVEVLQRYGDAALVVAGGTFVHGLEARGLLAHVEALVDVRALQLDGADVHDGALRVGATATYADLQRLQSARDGAAFGALEDALACPPVQIRNVATVGGCVAAACPFFDVPVALATLDAVVVIHGPSGPREMELGEFHTGMFENALEASEYVTAVRVPAAVPGTASAFIKLEGNANDLAIVNVAVRVHVDASGRCTDTRVIVGGGVGDTPVRSRAAERALMGAVLDDAALAAAGDAACGDVEPMSDHRASGRYRRAMAGVLTRRALARARSRLS